MLTVLVHTSIGFQLPFHIFGTAMCTNGITLALISVLSCAFPRRHRTHHRYSRIYTRTREVKKGQQERLQAGLDKLTDAAALVDKLKDKARDKSAELGRKQSEADSALQKIQVRCHADC
jgi:hypothetical protein